MKPQLYLQLFGTMRWPMPQSASVGCGKSRAEPPKPIHCSPTSMAGSPKALTPAISLRQRRCWQNWMELNNMTNNPDALKQNKSAQPTLEQARLMLEEAEKTHAVDRQKARAVAEEGLASCRMLDDAKLLAQALDLVGQIYQPLGLLVNAKALMEEALTLRQCIHYTVFWCTVVSLPRAYV